MQTYLGIVVALEGFSDSFAAELDPEWNIKVCSRAKIRSKVGLLICTSRSLSSRQEGSAQTG